MSKTRTQTLMERLPPFVTDLFTDRTALMALLASCVALAAAGLDPHVLDPGARRVQEALQEDLSVEGFVVFAAIVQAGLVLLGGAVADLWRSRRIVQIALAGLVVASLGATLFPDGPGLIVSRMLAWTCDGLIIPFAVGMVAVVYRGPERATALGILFAVYGATTALAPFLVTVFGSNGPEIQAFGLCALVAVVGIWTTQRFMPDLPGAERGQRLLIVTTGLWAFGVVIVATGFLDGAPLLMLLGVVPIVVALGARRIAKQPPDQGVHVRAGGAALAAGMVIGLSQAVPMLVVPAFFTTVQGIDGMIATLFVAPFAIALFVAGPAAGWLLVRYSPRAIIAGGTLAVALANVAVLRRHGAGLRLHPVHRAVRAGGRRVRHRHRGPDRGDLRGHPGAHAGHRRGAQRGVHRGGRADRRHRRGAAACRLGGGRGDPARCHAPRRGVRRRRGLRGGDRDLPAAGSPGPGQVGLGPA